MGIRRHFLGWNKPFILNFSKKLQTENVTGNALDEILVWLPSSRAARHLENELFSDTSESEAFHPPICITPAQFFRRLSEREGVATTAQCLYAWKQVIQKSDKSVLNPLFPMAGDRNQDDWVYEVSKQFIQLRSRIVEEDSSFFKISRSGTLHDQERWDALSSIESAYLKELEARDLVDPDVFFLDNLEDIITSMDFDRVILAGILNLSKRQEKLILELDRKGIPIDIYCPCPTDYMDKLDSMGRPIKACWEKEPINNKLLNQKIQRVAEPESAIAEISKLSCSYEDNVDVLVLGTPDDEYSQYLINRSLLENSSYYSPEGDSLIQTAWGELISTVFRWHDTRELNTLSDLLGNSLIRKWIEKSGLRADLVERSINSLKKEHLFSRYDQLLDSGLGSIGDIGTVRSLVEQIDDLLKSPNEMESLPETIWKFLQVIAIANELTDDLSRILNQMEAILQDLNEEITEGNIPRPDQRHLLLYQLESNRNYPEREANERPVVGWLELPWEVAPHMVIYGLSDSKIPGNYSTDTFLPPALCRTMDFYGPEEDSAFHAFRLRMILEARSSWGQLHIILTDKNLDGDPVLPSRFLFQANDDELLERTNLLLGEKNYERKLLASHFGSRLRLPEPKPLTHFSVTGFHAYLRNPLAFLLERRLKWEQPDPFLMEMNPMMFGNLAHKVLELLNRNDEGSRLVDPKDIQNFLETALDDQITASFGSGLSVPLQIQRSSLQERLRAASEIIGRERRAGWFPFKVEWGFHDEIEMRIDEVLLVGKIDLLEVNENTGSYRIIDYKTSDKNESPQKTHIQTITSKSSDPVVAETDFIIGKKSYRWKDLQLPIYQLAVERVLGIRPTCAYFCLGKAVSDIRLDEWSPDDNQLVAAERCAKAILRNIKNGYYPVPEKPDRYDSWIDWFGSDYLGTIDQEWIYRQTEGSTR